MPNGAARPEEQHHRAHRGGDGRPADPDGRTARAGPGDDAPDRFGVAARRPVGDHLPGGYPAMPPTPGNRALLDRLNEINRDLGPGGHAPAGSHAPGRGRHLLRGPLCGRAGRSGSARRRRALLGSMPSWPPPEQEIESAPVAVRLGRDLRGLDLAAPAPEDVGVADGDAHRGQVLVDGGLVRQQQGLSRPWATPMTLTWRNSGPPSRQ
jgi:hypothetical protein